MPPVPPPTADAPARLTIGRRFASVFGEKGSARRALTGGGAWNAAVYVVGAAVAFVLRPYMIAWLGDAALGVWGVLASLTGYLGLADLGVRPAVVHFAAKHSARGEIDEVNRYVNSAFLTFSLCGLVVLAVSAALVPFVSVLKDIPAEQVSAARWALLICGLDLALTLPLNAFSAVLVAKQRFDSLSRANLVVLAARTAAIVIWLPRGGGLLALALATLGGSVLEMVLKARAAFRVEPGLRIDLSLAERPKMRALLAYGVAAAVVALSLKLVQQTDALVIAAFVGVGAVRWFGDGAGLPFQVREFVLSMGRVLEPAAGRLYGANDRAGIVALLTRGSRTTLALATPMLAFLVGVGEPFLRRWLGDAFRGASVPVLVAMALAVAGPIASQPFASVLYGTHRVKALAWITFGEGIVNLALSIALARPLGIFGVALGTAIPAAIVHFGLLPAWVAREYGLSWARLVFGVWARPLVLGAAIAVGLRFLVPPDSAPGWPLLVGLALSTAVAYGALWLAAMRLFPLDRRGASAEAAS